jgi:hypothetical protein
MSRVLGGKVEIKSFADALGKGNTEAKEYERYGCCQFIHKSFGHANALLSVRIGMAVFNLAKKRLDFTFDSSKWTVKLHFSPLLIGCRIHWQ